MNKTFFNLNYKTSITIISVLGIIFAFLSNAYYLKGFLSFIFYILRLILFIATFVIFYLMEKNNEKFKTEIKSISGYLLISSVLNLICGIFVVTNLLRGVFVSISGVVCFWLIISIILINLNQSLNNKFIEKLMLINTKISNMASDYLIDVVIKKIKVDDNE